MKACHIIYRLTAIIIAITLTLFSCNQSNQETIESLNQGVVLIDLSAPRSVQLSELVEELNFVWFDIEDPISFGNVIIKQEKIYYHDLQQMIIYVFDLEGKLLHKLDAVGEGPDEYSSIGNFEVHENGSLTIYDFQLGKRIDYDADLEFTKQVKMDLTLPFQQITRLASGNYLMQTNHNTKVIDGQLTNCEYVLTDSLGNPLEKFFDKLYPGEQSESYVSYQPFPLQMIRDEQGTIYGNVNYDNSLYQFDGSDFSRFLEVEYINGNSIDYEEMVKLSKMDQMKYLARSDEFIGKVSAPNFEVYNQKLTLINYFKRASSGQGVSFNHYIMLKDTVFHASEIVNDFSDFPDRINLSYSGSGYYYLSPWYDGNLATLLYPNELLEYGEVITLSDGREVSYDDNPILLLMPVREALL
ncbi:6-bladed beta-propeller [Marinoscillum sp.]|uniref:6-bladed beta-propeller n=1 Tax=Marinoscillum sp. TaxID=2024838 RepID=UPI003BA95399